MSGNAEIDAIEKQRLADLMQTNIQEQNERGLWENNHGMFVQRGIYWEQKRQDINTAASQKKAEITARLKAISDAVVVFINPDGSKVTRGMLGTAGGTGGSSSATY